MRIVKFREPKTDSEAQERFVVLEDNGSRLLVQAICDMNFKPTYVYLAADMVEAET